MGYSIGYFTFEQLCVINDILSDGMEKGPFVLSLLDIYESTDDETLKSIIENLIIKIDNLSEKEFRDLTKKIPLKNFIIDDDLEESNIYENF